MQASAPVRTGAKEDWSAYYEWIKGLQYWLEQGDTRSIQIGRGVEHGCCFRWFYSTYTASTLQMKLLQRLKT